MSKISKEIKRKKELLKSLEDIHHEPETEKSIDPVKFGSRTTVRHWRKRMIARNKPETALVRMQLVTGDWRTMIIKVKEGGFSYRKRRYILDETGRYYDIDARRWCWDYHQLISLPIIRRIDENLIKAAVKRNTSIECAAALNPAVLDEVQNNDVIVGIFQGGKTMGKIATIYTMVFVLLFLNLAIAAVVLYGSGILSEAGL